MNEIDGLKAKARDFYWKYTAATTISSSSDAIAGLDRDAALPRECGQISVPGTEFRVMFLALGVSTAIAGPPLVFVASWKTKPGSACLVYTRQVQVTCVSSSGSSASTDKNEQVDLHVVVQVTERSVVWTAHRVYVTYSETARRFYYLVWTGP